MDGVTVGDNLHATLVIKYCKVDNLQIVWTRNYEHEVIHGISVKIRGGSGGTIRSGSVDQEDRFNSL